MHCAVDLIALTVYAASHINELNAASPGILFPVRDKFRIHLEVQSSLLTWCVPMMRVPNVNMVPRNSPAS